MAERVLQVDYLGMTRGVEVATTEKELLEAKALDDAVLGGHVGISMEELQEIVQNGAVLLLRDSDGKLIGESQVLTSPITAHPKLEPYEAYNYGTAMLPEHQSTGAAQFLFKAQEKVARDAGKLKNTMTVRLENAQSLRARFKAGYRVTGYTPDYYGPFEDGGARLHMEKSHINSPRIYTTDDLRVKIAAGRVALATPNNVGDLLASRDDTTFIGVLLEVGDEIDQTAHKIVSQIVAHKGYSGVGILKPAEHVMTNNSLSLLVFKNNLPQ